MEIYENKARLCTDAILPFKLYSYGIKRSMYYCSKKPSRISLPYKKAAALDVANFDRSPTGNVGRTFPCKI